MRKNRINIAEKQSVMKKVKTNMFTKNAKGES